MVSFILVSLSQTKIIKFKGVKKQKLGSLFEKLKKFRSYSKLPIDRWRD